MLSVVIIGNGEARMENRDCQNRTQNVEWRMFMQKVMFTCVSGLHLLKEGETPTIQD